MAQPLVVTTILPSGEYNVIDNGPAQTMTVLNQTSPIGFDTTTGALAQMVAVTSGNQNGSMPDFVEDQTVIINSATTGIRIGFLNPS